MKYYMITCVRGHVGNRKGTDIKFAIEAVGMAEAIAIARKMPSVKHSRFICCGKEISEQEYKEYRSVSAYERYEQFKKPRRNSYYY